MSNVYILFLFFIVSFHCFSTFDITANCRPALQFIFQLMWIDVNILLMFPSAILKMSYFLMKNVEHIFF